MAYTVIEHFKAGLARYKHYLSLLPGSLYDSRNVHIGQAGEVVKRPDNALLESFSPTIETLLHGLVVTSTNLFTFGSHDSGIPGGSDYLTYVQLKHPAVIAGAAYETAKHRIMEVVASCSFQNLPWVVAKFRDGSSWAYYGYTAGTPNVGTLVGAFRNGVVLAGLTSFANVAAHIAEMFSGINGLTVTTVTDATGNEVVNVVGVPGAPLDVDISATDSSEIDKTDSVLQLVEASDGTDGTGGVAASAILQVQEVTVGAVINSIEVGSDDDGWTEVIAANAVTVGASDDAEDVATAIAAAINAYAPENAPDYGASASGRTVYITTMAGVGASSNGYKIKTTVTGGIVFSDCGFLLSGTTTESVSSILADATELLTAPVARIVTGDALADNRTWATAIVANINANTAVSGYVASTYSTTLGGCFIVGKKVTVQGDAEITIVVTHDGVDGIISATDVPTSAPESPALTLSITQPALVGLQYKAGNGGRGMPTTFYRWTGYISPQLYTAVSGGSGTYNGKWTRVSGANNYSLNEAAPWHQPTFSGTDIIGVLSGQLNTYSYYFPYYATWRLDVEDTSVPKKTASLTIQLYSFLGDPA